MNKIIFALLVVILSFLSVASIWDNDIWSHLKTGEWIVQHHAVPSRDIFSYTAAGQPWIATSWLSQVIFYTVFHVFGIPGLIIFKSLIIIIAFMLLYILCLRQGTDALIAAVVIFLVAVLARERFVERPHIFSLLFLSANLYILNLPDRRWRWLIVPIALLWGNMHAENILGIMLCVVYVGYELIISVIASPEGAKQSFKGLLCRWKALLAMTPAKQSKQLGLLTPVFFLFSVIAVSFINPISWQAPFFGLISMGNEHTAYLKYVVELRPPTFEAAFKPFWCYTAAAILLMAFDRKRKVPQMIASAILLILAVKVRRFIPEFLIITIPGVASGLAYLTETMVEAPIQEHWANNKGLKIVISIAIFIIMAFLTFQVIDHQEPRMRPGLGVNQDALPVQAADFIAQNKLKGRMFNRMGQGGYLLWRLFPDQKVFIDGRIDVFGPELLEREVTAYEPQVWQGLMDQYHFDFAILDNMDVYGQYPARVLDEDNNWALVYFDDVNLIYVRKDGADAAIANSRAYHFLKPNAPNFTYLDEVADKKALKNELQRALQETPSMEAQIMLAREYEKEGNFDQAIKTLQSAIKAHPHVPGLKILLNQAMN